jgi:hypothetical protein
MRARLFDRRGLFERRSLRDFVAQDGLAQSRRAKDNHQHPHVAPPTALQPAMRAALRLSKKR